MSHVLYKMPNQAADSCASNAATKITFQSNDPVTGVAIDVPASSDGINYYINIPCGQYLVITYSDDTSTFVHGPYAGYLKDINSDFTVKSYKAVKYADENIMDIIKSPDFWKKEVMVKAFWITADNKPTTNGMIIGGVAILLIFLIMMMLKKK